MMILTTVIMMMIIIVKEKNEGCPLGMVEVSSDMVMRMVTIMMMTVMTMIIIIVIIIMKETRGLAEVSSDMGGARAQ